MEAVATVFFPFESLNLHIRKEDDRVDEAATHFSKLKVLNMRVIKEATTFPLRVVQEQVKKDYEGGLVLEIVSSKASSGEEQRIRSCAQTKTIFPMPYYKYKCSFDVPEGFGDVGAVIVHNRYKAPVYINTIVLQGPGKSSLTIPCDAIIHSQDDNPDIRVFFTNTSYLPSNTPSGLQTLREEELENRRGNGDGKRREYDRIYDYDMYNDLGDTQHNKLIRDILGGPKNPYPRRCRTGRALTGEATSTHEKRIVGYCLNYVPKDEQFSAFKILNFLHSGIQAGLHKLPAMIEGKDGGFSSIAEIDSLFDDGLPLHKKIAYLGLNRVFGGLLDLVYEGKRILHFKTPEIMKRDKFFWLRDEEFARETLAGINPFSIQLVTEWPMMSKLDPIIYGSAESHITKEIVENQIKGVMTFQEALVTKKLFLLDYHDLLLPLVEDVRKLENTSLYGSRTLFFLCDDNTLQPLAIELTRPPMKDKPVEWRYVFTPDSSSYPHSNKAWLWTFAKAHVSSHDSGYHQLVIHWLRTHCCMEPFIIAANRQLSKMHPIYRLLHPHFKYTMEINGLARKSLINAGGIIETNYFPGMHSMKLSSVAYDKLWRFDKESLPADLIRRGMAVKDGNGLKLTIEDYPFANDGLLLWDAIESWVTDYVDHYYMNDQDIQNDSEIQKWWTEVRTKGHGDKKDEPWWPVMNSTESLVQTLSTIIWVASGHHAAVNFGQYEYASYFPNRPSIARTNMPNEDHPITQLDLEKEGESKLMKCFPSVKQAIAVMAVLDTLSSHSYEETYIGQKLEPSWSENPSINRAFERFAEKVKKMGATIAQRNTDHKFRNRFCVVNGVTENGVPYTLLNPASEYGVTGKGVPNSISM